MFTYFVLRSYLEESVTVRNMRTTAQSVNVWESFSPFAVLGEVTRQNVNMVSVMTGIVISR
jgi:hypothetical protein